MISLQMEKRSFSKKSHIFSSVCFSLSTTCITSRYGRFVLIHFSPNEKLIQYKSMIPQTKGKFPMQFRSKSDRKNAFATQKPLLRVVPPCFTTVLITRPSLLLSLHLLRDIITNLIRVNVKFTNTLKSTKLHI